MMLEYHKTSHNLMKFNSYKNHTGIRAGMEKDKSDSARLFDIAAWKCDLEVN